MTAASTTTAATPNEVKVRRVTTRFRPACALEMFIGIGRDRRHRTLQPFAQPRVDRHRRPPPTSSCARRFLALNTWTFAAACGIKDVRDFRQRAILEVEESNGGSLLRRQLLGRVQQIDVLRYERRRRIARLLKAGRRRSRCAAQDAIRIATLPHPPRAVVADHLFQ
jgi:hypothetical protein